MKILIITTQIPYPPYRGDKLKLFNICKILNKTHKVTILTFIRNDSELKYIEALKRMNFDIHAVKHGWFNLRINLFRVLINSAPLQILCFHSKKLKRLIQQQTSQNHYDVVYFHLLNTLQYQEDIKDKSSLNVIDLTDSMSLYYQRYLEHEKNIIKRIIYEIELKKILKYEHKIKNYDTVFICSAVDRESLVKRNLHNNIKIFLNGFDSEVFKYEDYQPEKGRIIFTGNMPYFPNRDAVLYFLKDIFPQITRGKPYVKFYIVGQNPPPEIKNLESDNVIVKGFVEDIRKEYLLSEINVAPLRVGSGTVNKIIESLALGIPTVATSRAVMGFPDEIKKYIFIADTAKDTAEKIIQILNDSNVRNVMMADARKEVRNILNWDRIVEDFSSYLEMRVEKNKSI